MINLVIMMVKKRTTHQKEVIQKEMDTLDSFFNAWELLEKVKMTDSKIGIATIYRFLKENEKEGNLFSYKCDRKSVYSKKDKSHCHFICEKTGKIIHFKIDSLDFLKDKIPGTIKSFQIEIRGVCNKHNKKQSSCGNK